MALAESCAYEDAITFGLESLERFPEHALLRVALGRAYANFDLHEEALEQYNAAVALSPTDWRPARWYADGLAELYRWSEAQAAAERLVAAHPSIGKCHVTLGRVHLERGALEESLPHFDAAIEVDPNLSSAYSNRATALRQMWRYAEAQEWEAKAIEQFPGAAHLLVTAAWTLHAVDRLDEAAALAERAIDLDPRHSWALRSLAAIENARKQPDRARAVIDQAIAARPRDVDAHVTAAWTEKQRNDPDAAIACVRRALDINPRASRATATLIQILRSTGATEDAVQAADNALRVRHTHPAISRVAAYTFHQAGLDDRSAAVLNDTIAAHPLDRVSLNARISYAQSTENLADAVATALSRCPNDPAINLSAARHFSTLDEDTRALELVERALSVYPQYAEALAFRIDYLRDLCRYAEACEAGAHALALRPSSTKVRMAAANAYIDLHRFDKALIEAEKVLEEEPANRAALIARIGCLRQLGRYHDAHEAADSAANTEDVRVRMAKAEVFQTEGRFDSAIAIATEVWSANPGYLWALRRKIDFLRKAHRFPEALAEAERAVAEYPENVSMLLGAAWLHSHLNDENAAVELAQRAVALAPGYAWARQNLIYFLSYARRFEEAMTAAELADDSANATAYLACAWLNSDLGDDDTAIAWCKRALAVMPTSPWALTAHAQVLRRAERLDEAQAAAAEAVALLPGHPDVHTSTAWLRLELDDAEGALAAADRALEIAPRDVDAMDHKIQALFRLHRIDQAERVVRAGLEWHPTNVWLRLALSRVHEYRLAFDAAARCTAEAMRDVPNDPDYGVALSTTLRSLRRYGEAERLIARLIKVHPHLRSLRAELGWIHHDDGRLPDARRVFQELLDGSVNDRERRASRYGLGWVAFSEGRFAVAESEFRALPTNDFDQRLALAWALIRQEGVSRWQEGEVIAAELLKRRDDPSAHICLGVAAFRQEQLASAEYHFKRALEIDPYHGSHADLGALYVQMGRYEEAEAELAKAISRDWYDAAAHVELGALLLRTDRLPEAEREFRQALAVDPASAAAAIGTAQALAKAGDEAEAESTLRAALLRQDGPARWRTNLALARLLVQRGDKQQNADLHAEAYAHAQGAISSAPDSEADPHFVAGVAHHRMGSLAGDTRGRLLYRQRAMAHLRECLKRDSGHADAQRNLHLLERELKAVAPAIWGGYAVALVSIALLGTLWVTFFTSDKVTAVMLTTTTPVLVGLFTIAVLLPSLIKLKLPGFEADLQAGTGPISPGPTGQVTFGPGRFTVTAGPTGQLPRRE
ncbi:tetratricopeptide repeat protein [Actinokineospora diospyrosa]|uniref:tetratricopeptide repeat protein n=1 Tax=Actinokineospora diospyrosa TaxID=103728 RepID=UPI0031D90661